MTGGLGIGKALSHGGAVHAERSEQRRGRVRWLQLEEADEDMLWAGVSLSSPHTPVRGAQQGQIRVLLLTPASARSR